MFCFCEKKPPYIKKLQKYIVQFEQICTVWAGVGYNFFKAFK